MSKKKEHAGGHHGRNPTELVDKPSLVPSKPKGGKGPKYFSDFVEQTAEVRLLR